jgi:hypothetical protein
MKKSFALLLSVLLVLGLVACGTPQAGTAAETTAPKGEGIASGLKPGQLLVGYGKVNITPDLAVPLSGYGNTETRISQGFYDYLYATCFAVTDASGNTAILFGIDMSGTGVSLYTKARTEISQKYSIPMESIIISASHTHSAPDMGNTKVSTIPQWAPQLQKLLVECADMAMADRAPADLYTTITETENLNFVRRYKIEDGSVCGYISWINLYNYKVVGYESEPDRSLRLLKFDREEKPDILVANFQTHPHRGGSASDTLMTADLVGSFRTEIENKLGYQVVYFTGAAGNINPSSIIPEHNVTKDFREQGKALAKYAIDADDTYEKINGGTVKSTSREFKAEIDHSEDHLVTIAREANALWIETNDIPTVAKAYIPYGINGPYHAGAIISKASKGREDSFEIFALSFGDVGFAVAPYEMFDTNGTFIKENSPFPVTFVAECANGANGYFPSELSWDNRGYEVDTCRYVKGTAEDLADNYVEMLKELYQ